MSSDLYTWLKALHLAAAIAFVAGVLGAALFLTAPRPLDARAALAIHRWDQKVTTPAMLLVWALGLALAFAGGWFHAGWLFAKLVFVVVLSGVHGMQSAALRRLAGGAAGTAPSKWFAPLIVGCAVAIAILVVVKPM
ncbi:CopD family protein [Lichenicoccus sp.]|uniref:CopD family protein n=1 Tax=Lichenicoccus sp. TaxID=2781899 RepID=UPI003D0F59CC